MAVAFVGAATAKTTSTSITVARPAGVAPGHVMVAVVAVQGDAAVTAPTGWTKRAGQLKGGPHGGAPVSVYTFWKSAKAAADGSLDEPASYTFTVGSSLRIAAAIGAWSGVATVTPIDVSGHQLSTGNSTSVTAPSVTPSRAGSMLVGAFALAYGTSSGTTVSFTPPAGMTERADAAGTDVGVELAELALATADPTGTKTATASVSGPWVGQALVLTGYEPPLAPTWNAPVDGSAQDVAQPLTLDWTPNDLTYGDSSTAFAVRRQIGAGAYAWWRASDSTWQPAEVKNVSGASELTLPAGWGADGETHKYAVVTWDEPDDKGAYSSELTVIGDAKVNPTLDSPADGSTLTESSATAAWTVAEQSAYRLELLDAAGTTVLWDSGWVSSTGTRLATLGYALENATSYQLRLTTRNATGLTSDPDTNSFSVSFVPPPAGVVGVEVGDGHLLIRHEPVGPTGDQPDPATVDLYRREIGDAGDGIRLLAGHGLAFRWKDWAVASGRQYEYRTLVHGDNGASTYSAWAAAATATPVLARATAYWKARSLIGSGLLDLTGNGHDARLGATDGADSNDPLLLAGETSNYVYLPGIAGNSITTPHHASHQISGNIEVICHFENRPALLQTLMAKRRSAASSRSWRLHTSASDLPHIYVSPDGSSEASFVSTAALGAADGEWVWLRVTVEPNYDAAGNGRARFYTGASADGPWTQLGSDVTAALSTIWADNSQSPLEVGTYAQSSLGLADFGIRRAIFKNGIGGTTVADFDVSSAVEPFATVSGGAGETWTFNRGTSGRKLAVVDRTMLLLGADDYLEVPDHPDLDFGPTDSITVVAIVREWSGTYLPVVVKMISSGGAGWRLSTSSSNALYFQAHDGTNSPLAQDGAVANGVLATLVGIRQAGTAVKVNNDGTVASVADTTNGSLANAEPVRIGRHGNFYADMEFVAAALFREALSDADLALVEVELLEVAA